jgi:hypothetical protein
MHAASSTRTRRPGTRGTPNLEAVRWIARQLEWERTLRDLRAGATDQDRRAA